MSGETSPTSGDARRVVLVGEGAQRLVLVEEGAQRLVLVEEGAQRLVLVEEGAQRLSRDPSDTKGRLVTCRVSRRSLRDLLDQRWRERSRLRWGGGRRCG